MLDHFWRERDIAAFPGTRRHTNYEAHNGYLRLRGSEHPCIDGAAPTQRTQIQPQAQAPEAAAFTSHGVSKRDDAAALRVKGRTQGHPHRHLTAEPFSLDRMAVPDWESRRLLFKLPARVAGGAGVSQCINQIVAPRPTTAQLRHRRDAGKVLTG